MKWVASGFLFVRGHSIIHRLDPRVRLSISVSLFVVSLVTRSVIEISAIILLVIILALTAHIAMRFARSMVFTAAIAAVAFLLSYFVYPQPVHTAIVLGLRLFAVISSTSIFFLTTTPDELEHVMRWFKLPPDFVMVFVIAIRFVPVLLLDALQIMDAQRSRGLELERGNIIQRIRNTIPVLVPLLAVAVSRSLDLAEAMDSRAYGAFKRPTSLYKLEMRTEDWVASVAVFFATAIGFYLAFFVKLF
jgi:energy-coupling factor transport system permease protein